LVPVLPFDLGSSLHQFGLETSPDILLVQVMLLEEQAEGFSSTQLGNTGDILHAEPIQDLGSLQLAFAKT